MEYSMASSILLPPPHPHPYNPHKPPILIHHIRHNPLILQSSSSPSSITAMALKNVRVSDVPHGVIVSDFTAPASFSEVVPRLRVVDKEKRFVVIGHRGNGMNNLQSNDKRMVAVKENTVLSFNTAAKFGVEYVEFDVQVTKDGSPIIFHDNFIISQENGTIFEKRVTDLTLSEFRSYGPQGDTTSTGKPLLRETNGKIIDWKVESDEHHCTLQEAFEKTDPILGFNIELKFDDNIVYDQDYLISVLQSILKVVFEAAKDRPIIFSTFQPDAALLVRKLQNKYPVLFLTIGINGLYYDVRRNSLDEALKLCLEGGLQGIVSEVKGVFRDPGAVRRIKEAGLELLTFGQLNNVPEAVYVQHLMGVDGVIVDLVEEITTAVESLIEPASKEDVLADRNLQVPFDVKPRFSDRELSFLLKLIPELIQQ
ncbi:Glycerophosphodiester phosphodiesterase GDPD1, chloroplastic-like protein [Drosera capensis]